MSENAKVKCDVLTLQRHCQRVKRVMSNLNGMKSWRNEGGACTPEWAEPEPGSTS